MSNAGQQPARARPRIVIGLLAAAVAAAGCRTASERPTRSDDPGGLPASAQAETPAAPDFDAIVLPLLRERCSPCHFPRGSMHDRLPFDDEGTVRGIGRGLFTRIKDAEGRALLEEFLDAPPR